MTIEKSYESGTVEGRIYQAWRDADAFAAGAGAKPGAETYSIVIPPPNVTGSLHIGHALNNTIQDILIRLERMRGKDVLWQPGMDHAGIATQMIVERQLMERQEPGRRELGREKFLEKVWEWKAESGGNILHQLERLGASCDWSRERFTMDEGLSEAVRKVFVELFKKDLIYRAKRLVNWHPQLQTAISDLEVENIEVNGHMWHLRYPLADGATYEHPVAFDDDEKPTEFETRDYIIVATTRPETMLGDTAVAVNPEDERYSHLIGKHVILPLVGRKLIIVGDEHADPTQGSGAVKITPAHDFNDFEVGQRHDLEQINIFTVDAKINDEAPEDFRGLDRFEARKKVLADLEALGALDHVEDKKIMVPHDEKTKQIIIEPLLTDQWFVNAEVLAGPARDSVREGRTKFVPQSYENTYFAWMDNIRPWCISRQLWWGHQIPVWYGPDGQVFCAENYELAIEQALDHYNDLNKNGVLAEVLSKYGAPSGQTFDGVEVFAFDDGVSIVRDASGRERAESNEREVVSFGHDEAFVHVEIILARDPDVLDTWFSSALWPFSTLGWPNETNELAKYYPTSVLVTGFDIIFFWVARMMMTALEFTDVEPFHTVYMHALIRDEQGQKMSKTKGNVVDPLDLIDEYGADATRFTLTAMAAQGRDMRLSIARVEGYRNFVTKLWNAARFLEMNECARVEGFDPKTVKEPLNQWIIGATARAVANVERGFDEYRFNEAANAAYDFVWGTFCDWFVELAKPVMTGADEVAKAETRASAAFVLDNILKLLHPIMPFITEELWAETGKTGPARESLLILADWPQLAGLENEAAEAEMAWLIDIISGIRSVRAEMNVPGGAKIPLCIVGAGDVTKARTETHTAAIARLARIETIEFADTVPEGAAQMILGEATIALPLGDVIDLGAEKARLAKDIAKLDDEITKIGKKLENKQFMAKAPEAVIEEQRTRQADAADRKQRIAEALERLS